MIVFVVANIANFASFAFAAQSLLAALGSIQFVSNVLFARFVNKEAWNVWIFIGTAVIVAGCLMLVLFGSHESPTFTANELMSLYSSPAYITYLCVGGAVVLVTYFIYQVGKRKYQGVSQDSSSIWARWLPICYALFSAIIGTQSVLYGKSMSLLLRTSMSGNSQAGCWYTWIVVLLFLLTAAFWMIRFNKALKLFPVSIIMPVLQVGWIILSMISGSLYYKEMSAMSTLQKVMFGVGTAVLVAGVSLITTSSKTSIHSLEEHNSDEDGNMEDDKLECEEDAESPGGQARRTSSIQTIRRSLTNSVTGALEKMDFSTMTPCYIITQQDRNKMVARRQTVYLPNTSDNEVTESRGSQRASAYSTVCRTRTAPSRV